MKKMLMLLLVAGVLLMGTLSVVDELSQIVPQEPIGVSDCEIFVGPEYQDPTPDGSDDGPGPGGGGGVPG